MNDAVKLVIRPYDAAAVIQYGIGEIKVFQELSLDLPVFRGKADHLIEINSRLLAGRKPYDKRYKRWMDLILRQNGKYRIYDQKILKRLFHERWYNIVYYGMAYEKTFSKKLCIFMSFYPDGYFRFFKEIIGKRHNKR